MTTHRVLFVDLDKTLVLENTFHVFLRALGRIRGHGAPVALSRYACHKLPTFAAGSREARRLRSKAQIMAWFAQLPAELRLSAIEKTVSSAVKAISSQVASTMEEWRTEGAVIVLATAAPDAYVRDIARSVKADHVICSHEDAGVWHENVGVQKAAACQDWLGRHGATESLIGAISDHADDIPLLQLANRAYIHATAQQATRIATLAGLENGRWSVIDPISAQPSGGWWFYVNGEPRGPLGNPEARILLSKWRDCLVYTKDGWIPARGGYRAITPELRRDPPMMPSVDARVKMEAGTWLRRRIMRMTH